MKNKRGSISDIAFLIIFLIGFAIFILVAGYVVPQITGALDDSPIGNNSASHSALSFTESLAGRFDNILLIMFVGIVIGVFITSFMIESNPIFVPIYILLLGFLVLFAVIMENVYEAFNTGVLASTYATHTMTNYLLTHLVYITIAVGCLSMILIFARPRIFSGMGGSTGF
jgi:hypothetical protein